jgi:hypothetical protein
MTTSAQPTLEPCSDTDWTEQPCSPFSSSSDASSWSSHGLPSPLSSPLASDSFKSTELNSVLESSSDNDSSLDNLSVSNKATCKTRRVPGQSDRLPPSILARMDTSRVRRPQNAFFLFRRDFLAKHGQTLKENIEHDHRHISRIVAIAWKDASSDEREKYSLMAEEEKKRHAELYPDYRFSPQRRECVPRRRRVRRNGELDEERDKKIAKMILNGASSDQITRDLVGIDQLIETKKANEQTKFHNEWSRPCTFKIDPMLLPPAPSQTEGSFHYIDVSGMKVLLIFFFTSYSWFCAG